MKWIGERISFVDEKGKTTVVIHPQDIGWVKMLMGAWVSMWFVMGAIVTWSLFMMEWSQQNTIVLIVFLGFWLYFAFKVTRSWVWLNWGKELIRIDEVSLTYKKSIKRYGRAVPFYVENISKIRVFQPKEKSLQSAWEKSPWIIGGERIEFDYMGKVVRFGRKLNEKDAELLFKLVTKRVEEKVRKKKKH